MTGFRIARLLKFDERYKNIPFILLSDNDLASSKNIFTSSGADKILKNHSNFQNF